MHLPLCWSVSDYIYPRESFPLHRTPEQILMAASSAVVRSIAFLLQKFLHLREKAACYNGAFYNSLDNGNLKSNKMR